MSKKHFSFAIIQRWSYFVISSKYSRNSANCHLSTTVTFSRPGGQKNPYIDSCLKPLYNGHFLLSPKWPLQRGSTVYIKQNDNLGQVKEQYSELRFPGRKLIHDTMNGDHVNCSLVHNGYPSLINRDLTVSGRKTN